MESVNSKKVMLLSLNRSHVSTHTRIRLSRYIDTFKILIPLIYEVEL